MLTKRDGNNAKVLALNFNKAVRSHLSDNLNKFQNTKFNSCMKNVLQAICCASIYNTNFSVMGV